VDGLKDRILQEFSFEARALTLINAVRELKGLTP
jgi:hypothetical protein